MQFCDVPYDGVFARRDDYSDRMYRRKGHSQIATPLRSLGGIYSREVAFSPHDRVRITDEASYQEQLAARQQADVDYRAANRQRALSRGGYTQVVQEPTAENNWTLRLATRASYGITYQFV